MFIGGLQKLTLIDYPGKLAATVFCLGCNFRCPWCYSAELVLPEKIKSQPRTSEKDFFDFLKERKGLLEGVTICGGEPCLNSDLPQFCKKIKKLGYLVKVDTNGSCPAMLKELIAQKLIDYAAMDIKAPLEPQCQMSNVKCQNYPEGPRPFRKKGGAYGAGKSQKYDEATGIKTNLSKIKKSIEIIKNSGIDYEFRTTCVPGIHTKEDILQIARDISPAKRYYLQNFRPEKTLSPAFEKIKPYPDEYLLDIQKAVAPFFDACQPR